VEWNRQGLRVLSAEEIKNVPQAFMQGPSRIIVLLLSAINYLGQQTIAYKRQQCRLV
jgi:hypothetical protein